MSEAALAVRATCVKGYYLDLTARETINPTLGAALSTLGVLLVRMVNETAQHAGHADILRELIDNKAGPDHDQLSADDWREYLARVQAAADPFRPGTGRI